MFWHHSREGRTGWRAWWHFGNRAVLHIELYWWSQRCALSTSVDDEGWHFQTAFPPIAFYLSLEGFRLWAPKRKCVATWENNREFWLVDEREFRIAVHDYALWFIPWGRSMEWRKHDPWWVRGVTIRPSKLLGAWVGEKQDVKTQAVQIPMPEGVYNGIATTSEWSRGHRFWFKRHTTEVWLEIPKGIPHAGKGENSWDCDDDGLFGIGGSSVEDAIGRAVASVLRDRRRYGHASPETIRKALV